MSASWREPGVAVTVQYDPARERRGQRKQRERGAWVYIPLDVLAAAGFSPDEPPPSYRMVGRPHSRNRGRVLVTLIRDT